jgi:uncharacterized protein YkwD
LKRKRSSTSLSVIGLLLFSVLLVFQVHGLGAGAHDDQYVSYITPMLNFPQPTPEGCEPLPHIPADSISHEWEIILLINAFRVENGLPELRLMPQLTQAARRHAGDMAANDFRDHTGFDGSTAQERAEEACYELTAVGQILGSHATAPEMIAAWIASAGNRDLLLTTEMIDMGVAYVYDEDSTYNHHWVVVIGRPAAEGTIALDNASDQ